MKNKGLVLVTLLQGADKQGQTNAKKTKTVYVKGVQSQCKAYIGNPFLVNDCDFFFRTLEVKHVLTAWADTVLGKKKDTCEKLF